MYFNSTNLQGKLKQKTQNKTNSKKKNPKTKNKTKPKQPNKTTQPCPVNLNTETSIFIDLWKLKSIMCLAHAQEDKTPQIL